MSPDPSATAAPAPAPATDPNLSRRRLMSGAAAAGAVGLLGIGAASAASAAQAASSQAPQRPQPSLDEPMVVHLRDARTGELDLFTGHRHQRVQNPELAAALVRALG